MGFVRSINEKDVIEVHGNSVWDFSSLGSDSANLGACTLTC